jgi:hypothetical protein
VTVFTSHHGMGGKTVRSDTGIVPTSILVAAMPVGKEKESRRSTRAHASRSFSQWADEPRACRSTIEVPCCTGWGTVEAPYRAGLVRVGAGAWSRRLVERASYEADWIRGRGELPSIAVSVVLVFY